MPLVALSLDTIPAGKDDIEAVCVRRTEVDFWLSGLREKGDALVGSDLAGIGSSIGKMVMVRKVSIRRESMTFSRPR